MSVEQNKKEKVFICVCDVITLLYCTLHSRENKEGFDTVTIK